MSEKLNIFQKLRIALANQKQLKKIAFLNDSYDKDRHLLRIAAVGKLTDAATLYEVVKHDSNTSVRLAALDNPVAVDKTELAVIALTNNTTEIREVALTKTDFEHISAALDSLDKDFTFPVEMLKQCSNEQLIKIADYDRKDATHFKALALITDQELIAKLAMAVDHGLNFRLEALERLNIQKHLEYIALHDAHSELRLAALQKLEDLSVIAQIALCDDMDKVRSLAVTMTDYEHIATAFNLTTDKFYFPECMLSECPPEMIDRIALHDLVVKTRLQATVLLKNQEVLKEIALHSSDDNCKLAALNNLTDEHTMAVVAVRALNPNVRKAALEKALVKEIKEVVKAICGKALHSPEWLLYSDDQIILKQIAKYDVDEDKRVTAINHISDNDLLLEIAKFYLNQAYNGNPKAWSLCAAAASRLEDRNLKETLSKEISDIVAKLVEKIKQSGDSYSSAYSSFSHLKALYSNLSQFTTADWAVNLTFPNVHHSDWDDYTGSFSCSSFEDFCDEVHEDSYTDGHIDSSELNW